MFVSSSKEDILVTHSLGSCIGLVLYDPVNGIGGMIHCMLPLSRTDEEKARIKPAMFVDAGVPLLIQTLFDSGARREYIQARVAGASNILDKEGMFKIGERNHTVLRKILWKNNILISGEDVGGTKARTMTLYMEDGRTTVKADGAENVI
jgi:chemotaxis protein CheD